MTIKISATPGSDLNLIALNATALAYINSQYFGYGLERSDFVFSPSDDTQLNIPTQDFFLPDFAIPYDIDVVGLPPSVYIDAVQVEGDIRYAITGEDLAPNTTNFFGNPVSPQRFDGQLESIEISGGLRLVDIDIDFEPPFYIPQIRQEVVEFATGLRGNVTLAELAIFQDLTIAELYGANLLGLIFSGFSGIKIEELNNLTTERFYQVHTSTPGAAAAAYTFGLPTQYTQIDGTTFDDNLIAGVTNDLIRAGSGNDFVFGFDGRDNIVGDDGSQAFDLLEDYSDIIAGGAGNDTAYGVYGDDYLYGNDGDDLLWGQLGNDVLVGGEGDDNLQDGAGNDTAIGGDGNDTIVLRGDDDIGIGGDNNDSILGGNGNDSLEGGDDDDIVVGGNDHDLVSGGRGNDQVSGNNGDDTVAGGLGDDSAFGGMGDDFMVGDLGLGLLALSAPTTGAQFVPTAFADLADDDALAMLDTTPSQIALINFENFLPDDLIVLINEFLGGNDNIIGAEGDDTIIGGAGNDRLEGGEDDDYLEGGVGSDRIVAQGDDTIWTDVNLGKYDPGPGSPFSTDPFNTVFDDDFIADDPDDYPVNFFTYADDVVFNEGAFTLFGEGDPTTVRIKDFKLGFDILYFNNNFDLEDLFNIEQIGDTAVLRFDANNNNGFVTAGTSADIILEGVNAADLVIGVDIMIPDDPFV